MLESWNAPLMLLLKDPFCICSFYQVKTCAKGEAGSVTVLPPRCGTLSLGSIPGPGAVCPFGFRSKLASAGFSPGTLVFLLHLKLGFFLDYCLFLFVQRALLESSACSLSMATLYKNAL